MVAAEPVIESPTAPDVLRVVLPNENVPEAELAIEMPDWVGLVIVVVGEVNDPMTLELNVIPEAGALVETIPSNVAASVPVESVSAPPVPLRVVSSSVNVPNPEPEISVVVAFPSVSP